MTVMLLNYCCNSGVSLKPNAGNWRRHSLANVKHLSCNVMLTWELGIGLTFPFETDSEHSPSTLAWILHKWGSSPTMGLSSISTTPSKHQNHLPPCVDRTFTHTRKWTDLVNGPSHWSTPGCKPFTLTAFPCFMNGLAEGFGEAATGGRKNLLLECRSDQTT